MSDWLGKINFRYRRQQSLVLMTTEIFLVEAQGKTDELQPEDWMNGIKWFSAADALDRSFEFLRIETREDGLYYVVVDGAVVPELDAPLTLTADSRLRLVRLVALAGG